MKKFFSNKFYHLFLLPFLIAALPMPALAGGGGADVGGGNIEELSFTSYIFETASSLRTFEQQVHSNNLSSQQNEEILKTNESLKSALKQASSNASSMNLAELTALLEQATKKCPIMIVPEGEFCEKAPAHLGLLTPSNNKQSRFNCKQFSDRDFIGNKNGIIGREAKWLNAEVNQSSEALVLAIHEVVQNCLGLNDKKTSLSSIIGHISQKISESMLVMAAPLQEHPSKVTLVGFNNGKNSYGSGVCKISSLAMQSIEADTDIQNLETDFVFDLPSGERSMSSLTGSIAFNSLAECNQFVAKIRSHSERNLPIQFIFDRVYKSWKTTFIAERP